MNINVGEIMNNDECHRLMDKAVWLCFTIFSSLFLTEIVLIYIHMGGFIFLISMEEVQLSGCLLNHLLPLLGLLLLISGRLGVGYNTPQSSHCDSFV